MASIKNKVAKMIALANGEIVRHCHAVEAGILTEDDLSYSIRKRRKGASKQKSV